MKLLAEFPRQVAKDGSVRSVVRWYLVDRRQGSVERAMYVLAQTFKLDGHEWRGTGRSITVRMTEIDDVVDLLRAAMSEIEDSEP